MMQKDEKRHGSPKFYSLLDEMAKIHNKKSHDYANDDNPFGNYEFAGYIASLFAHSPSDAGFAGRLAEKMYRLSVLGKRGTEPKNESVADTERDIAVIATLWMASRRERVWKFVVEPGTAYEVKEKPLMEFGCWDCKFKGSLSELKQHVFDCQHRYNNIYPEGNPQYNQPETDGQASYDEVMGEAPAAKPEPHERMDYYYAKTFFSNLYDHEKLKLLKEIIDSIAQSQPANEESSRDTAR